MEFVSNLLELGISISLRRVTRQAWLPGCRGTRRTSRWHLASLRGGQTEAAKTNISVSLGKVRIQRSPICLVGMAIAVGTRRPRRASSKQPRVFRDPIIKFAPPSRHLDAAAAVYGLARGKMWLFALFSFFRATPVLDRWTSPAAPDSLFCVCVLCIHLVCARPGAGSPVSGADRSGRLITKMYYRQGGKGEK